MTGLSVVEVGAIFSNSVICTDFEIGRCEANLFLDEICELFALNKSRSEMRKLWNSWVGDPYDGIQEIIKKLSERFETACLSNTNELHWAHLKTYLDPDRIFQYAYASHLINLAKPNTEIYIYVLDELGHAPNEVVFLDDSQANIDAAMTLGIRSYKVDPRFGAIPVLESLKLLG